MLSKLVKDKIHQRFGQVIRYPKDCEPLAIHISQSCKTRISGSTLRRLYGFVKGIREPRLYTLDIIAEYLGHQGWDQLISSFDKEKEVAEKSLERLRPEQIKAGHTIRITYEPGKIIEIRKTGAAIQVVSSNEKKLAANDEVKFKLLELHYPITFTHVFRQGESIGRMQVGTVSGVTAIKKV